MKIQYVILSLFCILFYAAAAQENSDYYREGYLRYENYIYKDNIRTVILEQENLRLSDPVIDIGKDDRLIFSFDDLDGDYKNYSYTLIHCNHDWTPSNIFANEYLQGFEEDRITDYRTSFNTLQPYTHYRLIIPGGEVRPVLPGNYLLKVFIEGDRDNPVITRRLMVVNNRTVIEGNVHRATIVQDRESRQEVDFSVAYRGVQVSNPFDEIKVVVQQNGRWDNAIFGLKPLFLKDNLLEYEYDDENTFNGGNEYRTFDIRTLRIYTQYVETILKGTDGFTVMLLPEISRSFSRYSVENDINGKYLIRNQDGRDDHLEGEYVKVKFRLKHDILANGNFYVFGGLSDWRLSSNNKMEYNYDEGRYEAILYLKQGYYDYQYAFLEDGKTVADETVAEGNHFETRNEYSVLVYHRATGSRVDQLIGYQKFQYR